MSAIESGRKTGDVKTLKRIAAVLNISLLDVVDEPPADKTKLQTKKAASRKR